MYDESDPREAQARRKYAFDTWENRGTQAVVREPALRPGDIPGWRMRRESRNDAMKPPVTKSVWTLGDSDETAIGVEIYRAASLQEAHRVLLWLLGEFQSGVLGERTDTAAGDVAFGLSEPTMLLFARANCIVHVFNAGPRTTDVITAAKAIDAKLVRDAEGPGAMGTENAPQPSPA